MWVAIHLPEEAWAVGCSCQHSQCLAVVVDRGLCPAGCGSQSQCVSWQVLQRQPCTVPAGFCGLKQVAVAPGGPSGWCQQGCVDPIDAGQIWSAAGQVLGMHDRTWCMAEAGNTQAVLAGRLTLTSRVSALWGVSQAVGAASSHRSWVASCCGSEGMHASK